MVSALESVAWMIAEGKMAPADVYLMANEHLGSEELDRALTAVLREMRSGFDGFKSELVGLNVRLDKVNGRLDRHGEEIHERLKPKLAEHEFRISQFARVFDVRALNGEGSSGPDAGSAARTVARGVTVIVPTDTKTLLVILTTLGGILAAAVSAWLGLGR